MYGEVLKLRRWFRLKAQYSSVAILLSLGIFRMLTRNSPQQQNYSSNLRYDDQKNTKKKKVKVFLLMGQSNMVGFGTVTNDAKYRYPFFAKKDMNTSKLKWKRILRDEENKTEGENDNKNSAANFQRRVRYVFTSGSGGPEKKNVIENNQWLTMKNRNSIGVEIGIGYELGMAMGDNDDDILLLKSCKYIFCYICFCRD